VCDLLQDSTLGRDRNELFEHIINSISDGIAIADCDQEHKIFYVNRALSDVTGYGREELMGRPLLQSGLLPEEKEQLDRIGEAIGSNTGCVIECLCRNATGGRFFASISLRPVVDDAGKSIAWMLRSRNITERVQENEFVRSEKEKAVLAMRLERHDIMNALQAVQLYAEMLKNSEPANQVAILEKLDASIRRTRNRLSKAIDMHETRVQVTWRDLRYILISAMSGLDLSRVEVGLPLPGIEIFSDALIERAFYNLLDNSLRHGGNVSNINVHSEKDGTGLRIIYEDNGKGIRKDAKGELFKRGGGSESVAHGLHLVSEILLLTNMKIVENGEEGQGVRFEIDVPPGYFRFTDDGQYTKDVRDMHYPH